VSLDEDDWLVSLAANRLAVNFSQLSNESMTCNVDLGSLYITDERRDTDNLFRYGPPFSFSLFFIPFSFPLPVLPVRDRHVLGFSLSNAHTQPELTLEYFKDYTGKQTVRGALLTKETVPKPPLAPCFAD
jgi:hypothetical protein